MLDQMSDTFTPMLAAAVAWCHCGDDAMIQDTIGPVLELGMGNGSTPMLHSLCKAMNTPLVSIDNNREWHDRFLDLATRDHRGHQIRLLDSWELVATAAMIGKTELEAMCEAWDIISLDPQAYGHNYDRWSVVLIDHAPGERRVTDIARLANNATIIVVHDTEEPGYNYEPTLAAFKHRYDYRRARPWTTVVSNFVNVEEIFG